MIHDCHHCVFLCFDTLLICSRNAVCSNANHLMQDRSDVTRSLHGSTFAVYDGNGGNYVSKHLEKVLISNTIKDFQTQLNIKSKFSSEELTKVEIGNSIKRTFMKTDSNLLNQLERHFQSGLGKVARGKV